MLSKKNFKMIEDYIHSTKILNFDSIFKEFGIELVKTYKNKNEADDGYIGVLVDKESMRIKTVLSDSPGENAGLNVNDEIIAINSRRVEFESYQKIIKLAERGKNLNLLLSRRGKIFNLSIKPSTKPYNHYYIRQVKGPSDKQKLLYKKWLEKDWSDA